MASSYESFKEMNFTRDEVERITDALKDKTFRQLLTEYVEEVRDPENQKLFQQEITQLEKERGVDVTFINPIAGYVIKTSVNGDKKGFINICSNTNINKPVANPAEQDGAKGLKWSLPHSLAPPREDLDRNGVRCLVYDVVYHPDTLHLTQKNKAFRDMVNTTSCDAVESSFDVILDKKNLKFPKLQYKGFPHAAVIRKPSVETPPKLSPEDKEIMDKLYAKHGVGEYPNENDASSKKVRKSTKKTTSENDTNSVYTTPKYIMKQRRHVELEEFTEHKNAKINTATPKELVVEIDLPLLRSSECVTLDVGEKSLQLTNEKPAKYKLVLTLPYKVNQDIGNAKFDKDRKKLIVTLPVKTSANPILSDIMKDDSGVESDRGFSASPIDEVDHDTLISEINSQEFTDKLEAEISVETEIDFLSPNLHYSLPEFTYHDSENTVIFILNAENVEERSVSKIVDEHVLHIKFSSISAGFYPLYYAFYVELPQHTIETDTLSVEVTDIDVLIKINYLPCGYKMRSFLFGLNKDNLTEKCAQSPKLPSITDGSEEDLTGISVDQKFKSGKNRKLKKRSALVRGVTEEDQFDATDSSDDVKQCSKAVDIIRAFSESSSDEISHSYSPRKGRGILKRMSSSLRFGRSISESGLDDVSWTSSFENCHNSVDSVIPEEGESSTILKKTVRFNDVISRKLFRSNSSILGQRKKNQRKAKAKKRAQERRHSESEISEVEDKTERDTKTADSCEVNENNEYGKVEEKSDNDIFQLEINY